MGRYRHVVDGVGVGGHVVEDVVGMGLGAHQTRELLAHRQLAGQLQLEAADLLEVADQPEAEDEHQQGAERTVERPFQPVLAAGEEHATHAVDQRRQGDDGP